MSIQSYNFQDRYIRHRDFRAELTTVTSDLDRRDASFIRPLDRKPVAGDGLRFQAVNFMGLYLRHRDYEVWLDPELLVIDPNRPPSYLTPESLLFSADASFGVVPGLASSSWVSFQSVNYPDRYLRHRGFKLYLEPAHDELAKQDSTFRIVDGFTAGPSVPHLQ